MTAANHAATRAYFTYETENRYVCNLCDKIDLFRKLV